MYYIRGIRGISNSNYMINKCNFNTPEPYPGAPPVTSCRGKLRTVPDVPRMRTMTPLEQRFVLEYCKETEAPNGTQAAMRAGVASKASAATLASRWLSKVEVKAAIDQRKAEIAAVARIDTAWVLQQWMTIATADANELISNAVDCCRHCYGTLHAYQWTEGEYSREVDKAIESGKPPPDGLGGFGFNPHLPPHPKCPECFGNGVERVSVADTRKLKGPARLLYAGVKKTKDGIQVLTRDQDAALANIARYLGMSKERLEMSGPDGGPVPLSIRAEELSDDQLAAIVAASNADS